MAREFAAVVQSLKERQALVVQQLGATNEPAPLLEALLKTYAEAMDDAVALGTAVRNDLSVAFENELDAFDRMLQRRNLAALTAADQVARPSEAQVG